MPPATAPTACTVDPDAFDTNEDDAQLRALCYVCPLYWQCRTWAIASVDDGFAGGMSRRDRRKARKQQTVAA